MIQAYATITSTTPGTPIAITAKGDPTIGKCHGLMIQALPTNVGKLYVGTSALTRSPAANLFAVLGVPTTNSIPSFQVALTLAPASVQLKDFWIDVDTVGDGCLVTILVA